eukprot:GHRQ01011152.1.p1 GENE.GHRQ01011152.1~~GHRQ01011152.1.p1  ORF type:complete len:140 (+),score=44.32 GHRQ01011152.1:116-535(+)
MALRCSTRAFASATRSCLGPVAVRPAPYSRHARVACMASAAGAAAGPKYFILNYTYVPDILEKRGPYREAHLAGANKQLKAGQLVMAGAAGDPVEGAVFIFKNTSRDAIEAFVQADPYVQNGLVPDYSIKPYTVVVGSP